MRYDFLNGVDRGLRLVEDARGRVGARKAVDADLLGETLQPVLAGDRPALVAAD